ncbi:MAG: DUF2628 domain-containing protein [Clostridia bacterium]|nr:DUF2628 domain-containing protein [Clostridia bacterium]
MNNICEKCGTENEKEYKYCKNCGNSLECETEQKPKSEYIPHTSPQNHIVDDFDGVSAEEMALFIGKKSREFLPKFTKMQITNSKIAWSWPAAILGFLFGPLGSALWFFYRKMYKPAIILSVIGAVIMIATGFITTPVEQSYLSREALHEAADALYKEDFDEMFEILNGVGGKLSQKQQILNNIANIINTVAETASLLFSGLFGMYIYKNHCVKKIKEYRNFQGDQRFYKMGLAAIGGQSGGMLAVGIIIMVVVQNITTFTSIII